MEEKKLPKFDYYLDESDADIVLLRRQDGAFVAAFSARGATKEGILEAGEEEEEEMAHYFVTMDLEPDPYPQLPTDGLARIVREAILPSVEALVPLSAARKLVTGGYLVGDGQIVFVFEAESEEEVRQ